MSPPTTAGAEQSDAHKTADTESEDDCGAVEVTRLLTQETGADAQGKRHLGESRQSIDPMMLPLPQLRTSY